MNNTLKTSFHVFLTIFLLTLTINKTSKNLKNILIKYNYQKKKNKLIFSLDLKNNRNSVSDLFKDLIKNSISFNDVEIKKNNLEEIFLKLIDQ